MEIETYKINFCKETNKLIIVQENEIEYDDSDYINLEVCSFEYTLYFYGVINKKLVLIKEISGNDYTYIYKCMLKIFSQEHKTLPFTISSYIKDHGFFAPIPQYILDADNIDYVLDNNFEYKFIILTDNNNNILDNCII